MTLEHQTPETNSSQNPASLPPQPMSPTEERNWAMLAHLSVVVNLVTGFGGPIAALLIYLIYRSRSRFVAYHALQSLVFQLIGWYGGGILIGIVWGIVGLLSAVFVGVLLIPVALVLTCILGILPLGTLIYGIVGGLQVNQGQDFRYWLIGDWLRSTLNNG
ncbi:MAG: DUF4870 domain-containing protein [Chloroflexota bacterium]